jgi:hypothetical protein
VTAADAVPVIRVRAQSRSGSQLAVTLRNLSPVPQYQLQVYAVARSGRRYLAAGNLTVAHLGSQSAQTVRVPVVGSLGDAAVTVEARPTILN